MMERLAVATPDGVGELVLDAAVAPRAGLLLGHGAGSDIEGWDLALLARELPAHGVIVARYRQPHRMVGRKLPGSTASLDRGWTPAVAALRERWPDLPLFVGGHSAGARTACRGFDAQTPGVVALSFPLHPPGQPAKSRVAELIGVTGPVVVVQGSRDAFGTPGEFRASIDPWPQNLRLVEVPDATHPLAPVRNAPAEAVEARERLVVAAVADFIDGVIRPPAAAATP